MADISFSVHRARGSAGDWQVEDTTGQLVASCSDLLMADDVARLLNRQAHDAACLEEAEGRVALFADVLREERPVRKRLEADAKVWAEVAMLACAGLIGTPGEGYRGPEQARRDVLDMRGKVTAVFGAAKAAKELLSETAAWLAGHQDCNLEPEFERAVCAAAALDDLVNALAEALRAVGMRGL